MKKLLLVSLALLSINSYAYRSDYAFSGCQDEYRLKSNEYEITGAFSYQVSNPDASNSQSFNVIYKICDDTNKCADWKKVITVRPHNIHGTSEVLVRVIPSWHPTGTYPFKVTTDITKLNGILVLHSEKQCNLIVRPDNAIDEEYDLTM